MKPVLVVRHVPEEALGNLERMLRAAGLPLLVADCFEPSWEQFTRARLRPERLSGLVVMGGPMSANQVDRYPHLATEVEWLATAVRSGLPTLGICLGAQLLARAGGAKVYPHTCKEIGWYELEVLEAAADDPLFAGCA